MSHRMRRVLVGIAAVTAVSLGLTACGSTGPGTSTAKGTIWVITDAGLNPVVQKSITTFDKTSATKFSLANFANDPYKQKLQTAIGSPNQPDIFYNWGGGNLKQYVDAKQVADLTSTLSSDPALKAKFLPSVLAVGTINGKVYGLPMQGVQPVMMYANKTVLKKAGISSMATDWPGLLTDVAKLKAAGVTPIALAGSQSWTELMWLEYLLDRNGGPDKFKAIADGKAGAWSDPAVIKSLTMIQQLVTAGAFGTNYSAVGYDNKGTQALIAGGKAGYELMGSWEVGALNSSFPDFIKSDTLEWSAFPSVPGGAGDSTDIAGNPSNYFSVTAKSPNKAAAIKYLTSTLTSSTYTSALLADGQVPAIAGLGAQVKTGQFADFNSFTYSLVQNSASFTQSWDQALDAATAAKMLTNLQKVFLKQITPQQFAAAMGD
jgi:xylobiose transport system substrate-binding protein